MADRMRTQFHALRKRIIRRVERLWPCAPLDEVAPAITLEQRSFIDQPEQAPDLPADLLPLYRDWAALDCVDSLRRYTRPVTVDPTMGIVFVEGRIVWESSDTPVRERAARFFAHLRPARRRLQRAILLHHVHGYNYFHFFDFVVQKAWRAQKAELDPAIPLLLPWHTARMPFVQAAIQAGLFAPREVIVQGEREIIAVDEAYTIRTFDCLKPAFDWAASRLAAGITPAPAAPVMIVRGAGALNARQFRNQAEINAIAQERGVVLFDPAEHSLHAQIARFATASAIIGAHGAGLTNMMFCRKTCPILEIFPPAFGTPHYYLMARQRGFPYRWIMAESPIGKGYIATTQVPPERFRPALAAVLEQRPASPPP